MRALVIRLGGADRSVTAAGGVLCQYIEPAACDASTLQLKLRLNTLKRHYTIYMLRFGLFIACLAPLALALVLPNKGEIHANTFF